MAFRVSYNGHTGCYFLCVKVCIERKIKKENKVNKKLLIKEGKYYDD